MQSTSGRRKESLAPEVPSGSGHQALEIELLDAIREGNIEKIKTYVANKGETLESFRVEGNSLLHLSVQYGPSNLTATLIPLVNVNVRRNSDGYTALHLAAAVGRIATIEALLRPDSAIDETITNEAGENPITVACSKSVATAIKYGIARFAETMARELFLAINRRDVEGVRKVLENPRTVRCLNLNELDPSGDNFLHRAAKMGSLEIVTLLIAAGADPYKKNRQGKMSFELATNEAVRRILKSGNSFSFNISDCMIAPMVASPVIVERDDHISGYLMKYVNMASGYKRRFVTLEDGILSYYKSREDYPVNCKGTLNVQFSKLVQPPGSPTSFELRTEKCTYYFKAEGIAEAQRWIMALSGWQNKMNVVDHLAQDLRSRSRSSTADEEDFKKTLRSASNCLSQLEEHICRYSMASSLTASSSTIDPTSKQLIESLKDFFRICDEREQYWQGRLYTEQQQRQTVEDSKRKLILSLKEGIDIPIDLVKEEAEDEFYDAMDEVQSLAELSIASAAASLKTSPSVEKLEELPGPVAAIPVEELNFVSNALVGYNEVRRTEIPCDMTKIPPISIWSMIKNAIGKDLTRIPVPVNFSEPLSMLQRLCEDVEYADLLYMASISDDPLIRLQYVVAFAVAPYCNTYDRVKKPFNPLLGETYEYVSHEHGFRYISEQVSHHPPISACHCESSRYSYFAEVAVKTKFWGKSLELVPEGLNHVFLKNRSHEHFSWRKVNTAVYGIIVGKLWIDHFGPLRVTNHATGDYAEIEFKSTGWTTTDPHRVQGAIYDATGKAKYQVYGYWTKFLMSRNMETGEERELWRRRAVPPWSPQMYFFSYFAMTLNELSPEMRKVLCPTDCRLRPDQRAMEDGEFEKANEIKVLLEEKQRTRRRLWEADPSFVYKSRWFTRAKDVDTGESYWQYQGGYWESRAKGEWEDVLDIFLTPEEVANSSHSDLGTKNQDSIEADDD